MNTHQATMTKTKQAETMGEYKPTQIDLDKKLADIRIIYCNSGTFTIICNRKIELTGRGIKKYTTSIYNKAERIEKPLYEVTTAALKKLETQYKVVCDF